MALVFVLCSTSVWAEDVEITIDVKKGLPELSVFVVNQEKNSLQEVRSLEKGKEYLLYIGGKTTPRAFSASGPTWKGGAKKIKADAPLVFIIDQLVVPWNATQLEKDGKTYVVWLEQPDPENGGSIKIWRELGDEGYAKKWISGDKTQVRRDHLSVFPITDDVNLVLKGLKQLRTNKYPSPTIGDVIDQK